MGSEVRCAPAGLDVRFLSNQASRRVIRYQLNRCAIENVFTADMLDVWIGIAY